MRNAVVLALSVLVAVPFAVQAQKRIHGFIDPMPTARLKQLFPRAAMFRAVVVARPYEYPVRE